MIKEALLRIQSQKQSKRLKKLTSHLFTYMFLIAVSFLILQPLIDKFTVVFQSYDDLMDSSVKFIPKTVTLFNVTMAIEGMNYWSALRNTVLLCLLTAVLQTFFSAFIAYGFARFRFPGRRILFFAILVVLIIPPQLLMSPYYAYFRYFDIFGIVRAVTGRPLNLLDTAAPFCILSICGIGFKNSLYIYMMRQYYTNLPSQLEEAAAIDGAGALGTYFRIILPNARTMMVTVFLFSFSWQWTDNFFSNMLLPSTDVLSRTLANIPVFRPEHFPTVVRSAILNSGILLMLVPLIILYIITQRYFIEGVERSGIVG